MNKKFYKCKVCGDIHFGVMSPDPCPTCKTPHAYEEVDQETVRQQMGF
jgi:rubrerythrin